MPKYWEYKPRVKLIRNIFKKFFRFAGIIFILVIINYFYIDFYASPYIYDLNDSIPHYRVGLVLGTSKYTRENKENLFYKFRIRAAADLFKRKKVDYLLISGDNSTKYYNEPLQMKKDLVKKGVPADKIYLDYAGFSTYDSMVRAKEIFGLDSLLVISQDFHIKRAIFIARNKGLHAAGVRADMVSGLSKWRILLRETGARLKATWDVLTGKKPKFAGKKIHIG